MNQAPDDLDDRGPEDQCEFSEGFLDDFAHRNPEAFEAMLDYDR